MIYTSQPDILGLGVTNVATTTCDLQLGCDGPWDDFHSVGLIPGDDVTFHMSQPCKRIAPKPGDDFTNIYDAS